MAIALRGAGTYTESGSVSSTSVPYPATVAAGDLVVLLGSVKNAALVPTQTGFTTQASLSNTGSTVLPDLYVGTMYAVGTEGGTNFTAAHATGVNASAWQILVFSGVDPTTAMDVTPATMDVTAASTTTSTTGVTVATANAALVYCAAQNSTANTSTPPSGFTETGDRVSGTACFTVAYKLAQATGATGSIGNTWSGSARSVGALLTLRPASSTTSIPVTDAGSGADAVTVAASIPVADAGSGADSVAVAASIPVTDAGSASDGVTVSANIPLTDTGTATDVLTVKVTLALTDTGSGTDSLTVAAKVAMSDAGGGTDAFTAGSAVLLVDAGTATDPLAITAVVPLTDAGTATDTLTAGITVALADIGAVDDELTVTAVVHLADTGSGVDTLTVQVAVGLADTGVSVDGVTVTKRTLRDITVRPGPTASRYGNNSPTAVDGHTVAAGPAASAYTSGPIAT